MSMRVVQAIAVLSAVASLLLATLPASVAAATVIKIATLAPEGSAWIKTFEALDAELRQKTQNRVRLKIYPGGVLGDEKDMLRKMQIGQIHGAALTSAGLSTLYSEMDVFQIPFLFDTYEEVDHVLKRMETLFRKGFEKKGYVLLGWSEGGFIRLMSTRPIAALGDLRKAKVWTWEDAPMAKAIFDEAEVSTIPLSVPDVLVGLQTGLVEVVYAPPTAALFLQWFTKVSYITDVPLIYLLGGVVLKQNMFTRISAADQDIVTASFQVHTQRLKKVLRQENREALQVMAKHGVQRIEPAADQVEAFKDLSHRAMQHVAGDSFSPEVANEVRAHLEAYRGGKP